MCRYPQKGSSRGGIEIKNKRQGVNKTGPLSKSAARLLSPHDDDGVALNNPAPAAKSKMQATVKEKKTPIFQER